MRGAALGVLVPHAAVRSKGVSQVAGRLPELIVRAAARGVAAPAHDQIDEALGEGVKVGLARYLEAALRTEHKSKRGVAVHTRERVLALRERS